MEQGDHELKKPRYQWVVSSTPVVLMQWVVANLLIYTNFLLMSRFSFTSNSTSRSRIFLLRDTRSWLTCMQSRQNRLSDAVTRSRESSAVRSSYNFIFCYSTHHHHHHRYLTLTVILCIVNKEVNVAVVFIESCGHNTTQPIQDMNMTWT